MKIKQKNKILKHLLLITLFSFITFSCNEEEACGYTKIDIPIPEGCIMETELNLSTGIDINGNIIPPPLTRTDGVVDPFWKLLNTPSAKSCSYSPDGNAYTVNLGSNGSDGWVNQTGATSLSPFNAGDSLPGTCSNPYNSDGVRIAYVFERSFCVLKDVTVDLNFTFKADNHIYFELINNNTSTVINTSNTYSYSGVPLNWNTTGIVLSAGSYSIRAYLVNDESFIGFSLLGTINSSNNNEALSNNVQGCCENNVISVLNILDNNCNGAFDTGDQFGNTWTFNLKDSGNSIIRTATTDINGNIFFAGLPDGTYSVEIVNQTGWTSPAPITVTVSNNQVEIVEFFNCNN